MQYYIGSNNLDDIAVCLACPVVAKHPERHEIILYGGAVHFSKDHVCSPHPSKTIFGLPVTLQDDGWCSAPWQDSYMVKLSQEHGILRVNGRGMESIQVGDWVGILPVHSCLTADCMGGYLTLSGTKVDHMRGHVFD
jgi:D-serine deaminase-like pyridoxal phosphate-dependent protein